MTLRHEYWWRREFAGSDPAISFGSGAGLYEVTPQEANTHNLLLSQAEVEGLDNNCAVGLGGRFYTKKENGHTIVTTWLGDIVSRAVQVRGKVLTFTRKDMKFRGRLRQDEDTFFFKRIQ